MGFFNYKNLLPKVYAENISYHAELEIDNFSPVKEAKRLTKILNYLADNSAGILRENHIYSEELPALAQEMREANEYAYKTQTGEYVGTSFRQGSAVNKEQAADTKSPYTRDYINAETILRNYVEVRGLDYAVIEKTSNPDLLSKAERVLQQRSDQNNLTR